jgi:hypothetical protein
VNLADAPGWQGAITELVFEGDVALDQVAFGPAGTPEPPPPPPTDAGPGEPEPNPADADLGPVGGEDAGVLPPPRDAGDVPQARDASAREDFAPFEDFGSKAPLSGSRLTGGCTAMPGADGSAPAGFLIFGGLLLASLRRRRP